MELLDSEECLGPVAIAAHFVNRYQGVVNVERGVLEPLGHHWPAELLPLHDEIKIVRLAIVKVPGRVEKQNAAQKIVRDAVAGGGNRIFYVSTITRLDVKIPNVSAIDGKACRHRNE